MKKTITIAVLGLLLLAGFIVVRFTRDPQRNRVEKITIPKGRFDPIEVFCVRLRAQFPQEIEEIIRMADAGDVLALRNLGHRYRFGVGLPKNEDKAYEVFKKLAEMGDPQGMYFLGIFYWIGGGGVETDYQEAVKWFTKAAELNSFDAVIALCGLYRETHGDFSADPQKVQEYTLLAEKMAVESGKAGELYFLGRWFEKGDSLGKDKKKAYAYYEAAALRGHGPSMLKLASAYYEGTFVDADLNEARKWLDMAHAQGGESEIDNLEREIRSPALVAEIKQWYYQDKK